VALAHRQASAPVVTVSDRFAAADAHVSAPFDVKLYGSDDTANARAGTATDGGASFEEPVLPASRVPRYSMTVLSDDAYRVEGDYKFNYNPAAALTAEKMAEIVDIDVGDVNDATDAAATAVDIDLDVDVDAAAAAAAAGGSAAPLDLDDYLIAARWNITVHRVNGHFGNADTEDANLAKDTCFTVSSLFGYHSEAEGFIGKFYW
jgi:hypothetical protein